MHLRRLLLLAGLVYVSGHAKRYDDRRETTCRVVVLVIAGGEESWHVSNVELMHVNLEVR